MSRLCLLIKRNLAAWRRVHPPGLVSTSMRPSITNKRHHDHAWRTRLPSVWYACCHCMCPCSQFCAPSVLCQAPIAHNCAKARHQQQHRHCRGRAPLARFPPRRRPRSSEHLNHHRHAVGLVAYRSLPVLNLHPLGPCDLLAGSCPLCGTGVCDFCVFGSLSRLLRQAGDPPLLMMKSQSRANQPEAM